MEKLLILLVLAFATPSPTAAGVDIHVGISMPPPIVFHSPPEVVVIPETYVYVVPDVQEEIFFYSGWWWRPWGGRWYRSRHYSSGWVFYQGVPSFYGWVPSGWRIHYRDRLWRGHRWACRRIPHRHLERNWSSWERNRHWEKQQTWGVQGLKPRMHSQQTTSAVNPQHPRPQHRADQPQSSQPPQRLRPEVKEQSSKPQHREAPQQPRSFERKQEGREREKHDRT